jgi:transcription termination factor NusB
VAFDVLRAVRERDAYANLLLPNLLRERGLTGRDAALATELSYGTLRGQGTYDAVIAACSARGFDQIDPPVRDVLRLGTHQLLATRIGAHAAVATSVDLVREVSGPGAAGFVNAVLRRVGTRDLEAWITATAPGRAADPVGHLAVRHSHTRWIVDAISAALAEDAATGFSETEAALAASAGRRPRAGRRSALIWSPVTRRRSPRWGRAARRCRMRPASWPRSRSPGWTWAPRTGAGSTCAPGRAARRGCWPGWRPAGAPGCSPPTPACTGRGSCGRPSPGRLA